MARYEDYSGKIPGWPTMMTMMATIVMMMMIDCVTD